MVTVPGTAITSPNYPNNYDNSKDCLVYVRFAADQKVLLTVEAFDVEYQSTCSYDYLSVHDGFGYNQPLIGSKLCGTITELSLESTGNEMTLYFRSDNIETKTGFKVRVTAGI